ncbi:hypothetical protein [Phaeobacter inhibens]|uniref:hypothetical protein n=1 Tax=Phaeobacter inhibens TaxID=221822 RepID=UPI000F48A11B|nr:hypothetical protein [Phaeobacter inhibens]MDO6758341.1 hypothetical protein [Phaeobacter inhibens]
MKTTTIFVCALFALTACSDGGSSISSGNAGSSAAASSGQTNKKNRQSCVAEAGISGTYTLTSILTGAGMQQTIAVGNGVSEAQAAKANACLAS